MHIRTKNISNLNYLDVKRLPRYNIYQVKIYFLKVSYFKKSSFRLMDTKTSHKAVKFLRIWKTIHRKSFIQKHGFCFPSQLFLVSLIRYFSGHFNNTIYILKKSMPNGLRYSKTSETILRYDCVNLSLNYLVIYSSFEQNLVFQKNPLNIHSRLKSF